MNLDLVKKIIEELLTDLGFSSQIEVVEVAPTIRATVDVGQENALLIGFHGETLNSLQTVASLILFRQNGAPVPITIDVAGYRGEREEKIKQLAVSAADRARFLEKPIELSPMPPFERRLAHLYVSELPGAKSESVGEGRDRRVVVSPAAS